MESNSLNHIKCPQCASDEKFKNGKYKEKQRYQCKKCGSTYFETTNTSIHYVNDVDKWKQFVKHLFLSKKDLTLTALSEKFNISTKTAHNWKHKFLSSLIKVETIDFSNPVYMQILYFPFWLKGKRPKQISNELKRKEETSIKQKKYAAFLCVFDNSKNFDFYPIEVVSKRNVSNDKLTESFENIEFKVQNDVYVRKGGKLDVFLRDNYAGFQYQTFVDNRFGSNLLKKFQKWSKSFKGYSTKYMWNYLKWYKFQSMFLNDKKAQIFIDKALSDPKGWVRFMMIKHYYREFITE